MEETKVMHTLADTVEAYRKQQAEIEAENAKRDEEARQETLEALTASGLVPLRIEERNLAVFEYKGQEIKLRVFKDGYWQVVRQDVCKDCGEEIRSYRETWNAEDVGKLVVNPSWEYHTCLKVSESTPEERLISALRDVLGLNYD